MLDLGALVAINLRAVQTFQFDKVPSGMSYFPLLILEWTLREQRPLKIVELPISWGAVEKSHVKVMPYALRHLYHLIRLYLYGTNLRSESPKLSTRRII